MLSGLLLLCSLMVSAGNTLTLNVDPNCPQFVVTLPSNPTTGYQWVATTYDKTLFQLKSSRYAAPQTTLVGAGGQMTFTFGLIKGQSYPASTQMSFTYARPWDPSSGTIKPVSIRFSKALSKKQSFLWSNLISMLKSI